MAAARAAAVWTLLTLLAGTLAAADGDQAPDVVVGRVAGEPIYVAHVLPHVRSAPPRVGAEPLPDPRERAFDAAIATRLLAREARRRGLEAPRGASPEIAEAYLVQQLIHAEIESRLEKDDLGESELRSFFEAHRQSFLPLESARIEAIVVEDEALAERLLQQSADAGEADFRALVAEHSVDETSKTKGGFLAEIDKHGEGLEPALARVATQLRYDGAVGLAQGLAGRYYVLRASEVKLEERAWNDETARRVKNLYLRKQRDEALDSLVERLRGEVEISVDREALAKLPVPAWGETDLQAP